MEVLLVSLAALDHGVGVMVLVTLLAIVIIGDDRLHESLVAVAAVLLLHLNLISTMLLPLLPLLLLRRTINLYKNFVSTTASFLIQTTCSSSSSSSSSSE